MPDNKSKIYLISANAKCKSNSIVSAQLISYFSENSCQFTRNMREADTIVINTCGFIDATRRLSLSIIENMLSGHSPDARVICVGCLGRIDRHLLEERYARLLIVEDLEQLDAIIGVRVPFRDIPCFHYERLSLDRMSQKKFYVQDFLTLAFCRLFRRFRPFPLSQILEEETDENKIFIQIGSGCLNQCSYCVIKKARGKAVSRPIPDILGEIKKVYRSGVSLNLVADDCGSYGWERGDSLVTLLHAIGREYPGIPLELSYLHPRWLKLNEDEYLDVFSKINIKSINVSLQSGSDRVISSMKRGYDVEGTARILARIKHTLPATLIWGYFIVGYPLEGWRDFFLTVRATRYYDLFQIFGYSPVNDHGNGASSHAGSVIMMRRLMLKLVFYYRLLCRTIVSA